MFKKTKLSHSKILTEIVAVVRAAVVVRFAPVTAPHVTNNCEDVVEEDERRWDGWFVEVLVNEREAIEAPGSLRLLLNLLECIAEHDNIISNTSQRSYS